MSRRVIAVAAIAGLLTLALGCSDPADELSFDVPPSESAPSQAPTGPSPSEGTAAPDRGAAEPDGGADAPAPTVPTRDVSGAEPASQTIVGLGVNGQPRMWGSSGAALLPALERLIDEAGVSMFRLEIFDGHSDWEAQNDDSDPASIEWDAFDAAFADDRFSDLFAYMRALNSLGVTSIELSAHGLLPSWMGGDFLDPAMEPEFVETLIAFLVYATSRAPEPRPEFRWFSPWNETDLGPPEGFAMDVEQQTRLIGKLLDEMERYPELADIGLVVPESAWEETSLALREQLPAADTERVASFAAHRYGGRFDDTADFREAEPSQWLTEFNDWAGTCYEATWDNALNLALNGIGALRSGHTAALVWTEVDAPHYHSDDAWETFGLLEPIHPDVTFECDTVGQPSDEVLDSVEYLPKPTYDALAHIAASIRPGAVRVPLESVENELLAVAFRNPDGSLVVVGANDGEAITTTIGFAASDAPDRLTGLVSTETARRQAIAVGALDDGRVEIEIPARSIVSLAGPGGSR